MSALKFRAYHHKSGQYIKVRTTIYNDSGEPIFISSGGLDAKRIPISEVTLERWTGHYDREGTPIWEGDLLQQYNHLYGEYYEISGALVVVEWKETGVYSGFGITAKGAHRFKVVGNKHQHTEVMAEVGVAA